MPQAASPAAVSAAAIPPVVAAAAAAAIPPVAGTAATVPSVATAAATILPPSPATLDCERPWLGRALVLLVMLLAALLSVGGSPSAAEAAASHDVASSRSACSVPATFALEALDIGAGSRRPRFVGVAGSWDGFSRTLPLRRERDGRYAASVRLPCGLVTYQYNVDGTWIHNPRFASQIGARPPGLRRTAANLARALSLPARRLGRLLRRLGAPPTASPSEQRQPLELYNLLEVARPPQRRAWWRLM